MFLLLYILYTQYLKKHVYRNLIFFYLQDKGTLYIVYMVKDSKKWLHSKQTMKSIELTTTNSESYYLLRKIILNFKKYYQNIYKYTIYNALICFFFFNF